MTHALVLRTCSSDMTSHGGFRWPEKGPVECPDWDPKPECGHGLHGLLYGEGDAGLLSMDPNAKWLVVRVELESCVDLHGKAKFPRGHVLYAGTREKAVAGLVKRAPGHATCYAQVTAGEGGKAPAGHGGKAMAGHQGKTKDGNYGTTTAGHQGKATAGNYGTATAGNYGTATAGNYGTATAGYRGTATAGFGGTATAGFQGTATAGYGGTATAGDGGTATVGDEGKATAGRMGTATAGREGRISIDYWDGTRMRVATGYVGEGIEAGRSYQVENGKLVLV